MSLSIVPAVGAVLERILDDTYPIWRDGLSRQNYGRYWDAQLKTAWGQTHLGRVALQDGPHVVASAKRFDLSMQIDGRIRRVLGLGAVFTAPAYRGRGAAKELITRMIETGEAEGFEFAALFFEIAPRLYEQLDFVPVPPTEWRLTVDQKGGGPPAILLRSGEDRDLPAIDDQRLGQEGHEAVGVTRAADCLMDLGEEALGVLLGLALVGGARFRRLGRGRPSATTRGHGERQRRERRERQPRTHA